MVVDFMVHLLSEFLSPTVKELLKSDGICQSYAQIKMGPVFLTHSVYTPWAIKKHATQYSFITLTNADQFFKILSMLDSAVNLSRDLCYMSNHTYNVSLHYFVKNVIKNSKILIYLT